MQWVGAGEPGIQRQRGKWVVRQAGYDPATGGRRVRQFGTFDTKRAAQARLKAVTDGRVGPETETLREFLEQVWLPSKVGRVEVSSLDQYRWAIDKHIVPLLGAVRLRDLSPEVVDGWLGELTAMGESGKPRVGATSARTIRKTLSMPLEEAVQRGRLPRNPVALTQPPRRDRTHRKLGWTLDEARIFLAGVTDHRLYAAFHLGLVTGLRRGELLALRWQDVDLENRCLVVVQQLATERGRPVLKQLKTEASERTVSFGPSTTAVLVEHARRQEKEAEHAGELWEDSGLVFTTALGGHIDPNNFSRTMDVLVEKAGVPRITPKGLRHTAQSVGRVVVGDDKVMQERLGHSDIGITLGTYTSTVTEQHRQAGERLDEVFAAQERVR
ncbi:MAG: site-specific integrase [Acidimicrobiia bacterium]|nr:site-specific integrase [Acidimicrobiia bacterium]MBV8295847.1 site-specific integrase [Acidimicrobiia bacterium]